MATKEDLKGGQRKLVLLPDALCKRIEDYRYAMRHKSEADAFRELLESALDRADKSAARRAAVS